MTLFSAAKFDFCTGVITGRRCAARTARPPFVAREGRVPGEPRPRSVGRHLADRDDAARRETCASNASMAERADTPGWDAQHEQPADDALGAGDVAHRGDDAPVAAAVELLYLDHVDGVRAERPAEPVRAAASARCASDASSSPATASSSVG